VIIESREAIGPRILIRGGGFSNKGDQAMGLTVKQELGRRLPLANFWNRVPPEQVEAGWSSGYLVSAGPAGRLRKGLLLGSGVIRSAVLRRAAATDPLSALEISQLGHVDGVIDIGGFAYGDVWGETSARRAAAWARYCRSTGKLFIAMPQAWGPFERPRLAGLVREIVECSTDVYARDRESLAHLLGLDPAFRSTVTLAPDIAFCLEPSPPAVGQDILRRYGLSPGTKPIVGICPNMRVYERTTGVGYQNRYVRTLIDVASFCMNELGAAVALIPHERVDPTKNKPDDRFLCALVAAVFSSRRDCAALPVFDSPAQSLSVLGHLDLVVGSRYHTLVLGLSAGVPCIALGWSHKYEQLLADVGFPDFAFRQENLNFELISQVISRAWHAREEYRTEIVRSVADLRSKVGRVFDHVAERLHR
jgi:colanic acid/amylovoran biosynthesis protein